MRFRRVQISLVYLAAAAMVGCTSPLENRDSDLLLLERVQQAIERELDSLPADEDHLQPTQPQGRVEAALADRLDELAALRPQVPFDRLQMDPNY